MSTLAEDFVTHMELERGNESAEFIKDLELWCWGDPHWLTVHHKTGFLRRFKPVIMFTSRDRDIPKEDLVTQFQDGSEARWRDQDLDWFVN